MSTLAEATNVKLEGYQPVTPPITPTLGMFQTQFPPNPNPIMRCPLPPLSTSPDSLRQYYVNGNVPQTRIFQPSL